MKLSYSISRLLVLLLLVFTSFTSFGQQKTVTGKVFNQQTFLFTDIAFKGLCLLSFI